MKRLGIDIGSTTVKVAVIDEEHNILFSEYKRHFANIKETLKELVEHASKELGNVEVAPTITGSGGLALAQVIGIPFEQEVVCVSEALTDYAPQTDVAIELPERARPPAAIVDITVGKVFNDSEKIVPEGTEFQIPKNENITSVKTHGFTIGKTILVNIPIHPAPSICAASISA